MLAVARQGISSLCYQTLNIMNLTWLVWILSVCRPRTQSPSQGLMGSSDTQTHTHESFQPYPKALIILLKALLISGNSYVIDLSELFDQSLNLFLCGIIRKIHQVESSLEQAWRFPGSLPFLLVERSHSTDQVIHGFVIEKWYSVFHRFFLLVGNNSFARVLTHGVLD